MADPRLLPVGETVTEGSDTPERDIAKAGLAKPGFHGKKGRSGPPKGNTNAIRHGLVAGKLPRDCQHIEIKINALRRTLEDAVMAAKGAIGIVDAAIIQSCCKWERHGALALRWLTKSADELKPVERLQFSREIARASTERDRSLAALGLHRDENADAIAALYTRDLPSPSDAKGDGDESA
jgi:hypothetical protein